MRMGEWRGDAVVNAAALGRGPITSGSRVLLPSVGLPTKGRESLHSGVFADDSHLGDRG